MPVYLPSKQMIVTTAMNTEVNTLVILSLSLLSFVSEATVMPLNSPWSLYSNMTSADEYWLHSLILSVQILELCNVYLTAHPWERPINRVKLIQR